MNHETYTAGCQVTGHPPPVSITILLVAEHRLEGVAEGEVQGLGWEVTDNVGSVTTPEGNETLIGHGAAEAVANAGVWTVETTALEHLILSSTFLVSLSCSPLRKVLAALHAGCGHKPFLRRPPLCTTYLVLDEELDTLDGSGGGLGDGGGNTTHCECTVSHCCLRATSCIQALIASSAELRPLRNMDNSIAGVEGEV